MTISDITELLQQAGSCKTEAELLALFEEAGEDIDKAANRRIFENLPTAGEGLAVTDETAALYSQPVICPKCRNTSVYSLLSSAAEVLSAADTVHFGCCECGTSFTVSAPK